MPGCLVLSRNHSFGSGVLGSARASRAVAGAPAGHEPHATEHSPFSECQIRSEFSARAPKTTREARALPNQFCIVTAQFLERVMHLLTLPPRPGLTDGGGVIRWLMPPYNVGCPSGTLIRAVFARQKFRTRSSAQSAFRSGN
jgi:hypothetical protein